MTHMEIVHLVVKFAKKNDINIFPSDWEYITSREYMKQNGYDPYLYEELFESMLKILKPFTSVLYGLRWKTYFYVAVIEIGDMFYFHHIRIGEGERILDFNIKNRKAILYELNSYREDFEKLYKSFSENDPRDEECVDLKNTLDQFDKFIKKYSEV